MKWRALMLGGAVMIAAVTLGGQVPVAAQTSTAPVAGLQWEERPNGEDFSRHYPPAAFERGISGRVMLSCVVQTDGRLACATESENPAGYGFGAAALEVSRAFRLQRQMADGRSTIGGRIRIPIAFVAD